jgi:hypothetical protein
MLCLPTSAISSGRVFSRHLTALTQQVATFWSQNNDSGKGLNVATAAHDKSGRQSADRAVGEKHDDVALPFLVQVMANGPMEENAKKPFGKSAGIIPMQDPPWKLTIPIRARNTSRSIQGLLATPISLPMRHNNHANNIQKMTDRVGTLKILIRKHTLNASSLSRTRSIASKIQSCLATTNTTVTMITMRWHHYSWIIYVTKFLNLTILIFRDDPQGAAPASGMVAQGDSSAVNSYGMTVAEPTTKSTTSDRARTDLKEARLKESHVEAEGIMCIDEAGFYVNEARRMEAFHQKRSSLLESEQADPAAAEWYIICTLRAQVNLTATVNQWEAALKGAKQAVEEAGRIVEELGAVESKPLLTCS